MTSARHLRQPLDPIRLSWLRRTALRMLALPAPDAAELAAAQAEVDAAQARLRVAQDEGRRVEELAAWRDARVARNHIGALVEDVITLRAGMMRE